MKAPSIGSWWANLPAFPLVSMWLYPRMILWFLIITALCLLARLPFAWIHLIPGYLSFQPDIALVPVAGAVWGPAGVWGCLAASLLGDHWLGLSGPLAGYRAAGVFFYALTVQVLAPQKKSMSTSGLGPSLLFVFSSLAGGLLCASWTALGSESLRIYPFSYVASLLILNHVVFVILFGLPLLNLVRWQVVRRFGSWRDILAAAPQDFSRGPLSRWMLVAACLGSCAAGLWVSASVYRISLLQPFMLGIASGPWVSRAVWPFLLLHLYGLFRREK